jgi:hypothetical protein
MDNEASMGMNRTGMKMSPFSGGDMAEFAESMADRAPVDGMGTAVMHRAYVVEADTVGSVPIPGTVRGALSTVAGKLMGDKPEVFIDKLGERLAFERTGARLYDALLMKCDASGGYVPPAGSAQAASDMYGTMSGSSAAQPGSMASQMAATEAAAGAATAPGTAAGSQLGAGIPGTTGPADASMTNAAGEASPASPDVATLVRIRTEEERHFLLVQACMTELGADPTAMTPCADVAGVASMGLMQTVTDPRTSISQCLNALLTAELTDNAGWELLCELAQAQGHDEMAGRFRQALAEEQQHLALVKGWLRHAVLAEAT